MGHSMDYLLYVMDTRALEDDAEFERWLEMVSEYRRRKVLRLRRREDRNASLAADFAPIPGRHDSSSISLLI